MEQNTAVIVSTCDEYSDCWAPLIYCFDKYWSDCPFQIFFISNYKEIVHPKIKFITIGEHLGWATNTKKALQEVNAQYIIYLQEDYFFDKHINTSNLINNLNYCLTKQIHYLRLGPPFRTDSRQIDNRYNADELKCKYALSLQPAIWKKSVLSKLCIDGYTGWDFEFKIADYIISNKIQIDSLVIHPTVFHTDGFPLVAGTAVRKGLWTRKGRAFLLKHNFGSIINGRQTEGSITTLLISIQNKYLKFLTWRLLRFLQRNKLNI